MKNILVLAYAVSPVRGSEYAVAWNYIVRMSETNHLTVLFGCGGDHIGDFEEMFSIIHDQPIKNVTFVPVYPNRLTNFLNILNRKGLFVYSFYLAYQVWHKQAYKTAKDIINNKDIDLIHYLGPIGYREPGYLWKLGLPYMWGPIGGAVNSPWSLFKHLSLSARMHHGFHNVANTIQLQTKIRLKKAIKHTDLLLAVTTENCKIFEKLYAKKCLYLPENCLTGPACLYDGKFKDIYNTIRLIFVGRLDYGKNLTMLLQALQLINDKERIHLDVIGDGPIRPLLEKQTKEYGLNEIVSFYGKLPREQAVSMFKDAHLHVITSMNEANTTVFFEAMSHGVPTLTLDHCGMHDTVKETTGYKVPLSSNYEEMVHGIANVINHIILFPEELKKKAKAVIEDSYNYQWSSRVLFFESCYNECINNHFKNR